MPQVSIYIREDDYEVWRQLKNKGKVIHYVLTEYKKKLISEDNKIEQGKEEFENNLDGIGIVDINVELLNA